MWTLFALVPFIAYALFVLFSCLRSAARLRRLEKDYSDVCDSLSRGVSGEVVMAGIRESRSREPEFRETVEVTRSIKEKLVAMGEARAVHS